jgi:hypothetical protein
MNKINQKLSNPKTSPVIILSLLVPEDNDVGHLIGFQDEDIIGVFKSVKGAHRAISALLKYMELSDVFWDESIIRKEAGITNLLLEIEARRFNVIKSNKADEFIITCRDIIKKSSGDISAEDISMFDLSEEELQDMKLDKKKLTLERTKRLYMKILICHTGKLFNLPEDI